MSSLDRRKLMALGAGAAAAAVAGPITTGTPAAAAAVPSNRHLAASLDGGFTSRYADVNGIRLHYVIGGRGAPLILLHGWPQTWWSYHKIMPALAQRYRVIVPDLRGIGGSSKPASGYDKKTMAQDILGLARSLGLGRVNVAGHDVGAMIAFSLAANHPDAVDKIAMLDVTHPHQGFYEFRALPTPGSPFHPWWFAFNSVPGLPEQLVAGRSRYLVDWMFDYLLVNKQAIDDFDRSVYAYAYSTPDAIRGGNGWYQAIPQDIADNETYSPLTTPMLGLAHPLFYPGLAEMLSSQGTDVQVAQIDNTGHYFIDEQPEVVVQHLLAFFG